MWGPWGRATSVAFVVCVRASRPVEDPVFPSPIVHRPIGKVHPPRPIDEHAVFPMSLTRHPPSFHRPVDVHAVLELSPELGAVEFFINTLPVE